MIEVNILELKNNIISLNSLIEEYKEIKLNLFNQLKESCISWQDGNSTLFDNGVNLDKREIELFINSLLAKKNVFEFVYNKYEAIGKKIKCNLLNKNALIDSIDNCINNCQSIIDEFNRIDRSFYYNEQQSISSQKNRIFGVKENLIEIKSSVSAMYNKIEAIEKSVNLKIKELDEIKKNNFDFVGI